MSKYVGKIVTNQAPAGYSVYFDGTGDYLTVPDNTALEFGSSDFTIEAWFYFAGTPNSTNAIVQKGGTGTSNLEYFLNVRPNSSVIEFSFSTNGTTLTTRTSSSVTIAQNTWHHVAVARTSATLYFFLNGVSAGTAALSSTLFAGNADLGIGASGTGSNIFAAGYISNLRILKGTALYTAAFTPPTQLFPITNTSLLTCQSPSIVDNSSNAFAITTNGNAAVSTFTPFAAYNPAPTTANPLVPAPGVWTLDEALQYTQQGVWPSPAANAIEDVFSTYLYTGTGATRTITNNIDLSTYGGLVWFKQRNQTINHALYDTARGATKALFTNATDAQFTVTDTLTGFTTSGFTLGADAGYNYVNNNGFAANTNNYVSWTFRKQAKFFDIVTYTGNGGNRTIPHNLGSVPGCIIVKRVDSTSDWRVYHRSLSSAASMIILNSTSGESSQPTMWNSTAPTSTEFSIGTATDVNAFNGTYVAYLFAHDAGGFGPAGTDSVISCGSFNATSGTATVTLGWEPQFVLIKPYDAAGYPWYMADNLRGMPTIAPTMSLRANVTNAEASMGVPSFIPTPTGFNVASFAANNIYIAIRRGPMRPPLTSTSVFTPIKTGSGSTLSDSYASIGFPIDMTLRYQTGTNTSASYKNVVFTRLLGINSGATDTPTSINNPSLLTPATDAVATGSYYAQTGSMSLDYGGSWSAPNYVLTHLHFRRAPGFFDVVYYSGTGANRTISHNLTVPPEMMIIKRTNSVRSWSVYTASTTNSSYLYLNTTAAPVADATVWNNTTPTSTVFSLGTALDVNASGSNYIAYLFATVGGISKVGSYIGTGTTQQINCGFTNGSRFVMIKRTDTTGDWYVWDSARGIVVGNDPYLLLNSTAAEVTGTDYVDTYSAGFELSSTAPAALNASGGTYIFYAIA